MSNEAGKKSLSALSSEFVPWQVVSGKTRSKTQSKTQRSKPKDEVKFQVHLNHFQNVESIPFDILVDVPAENCINCLGPRHSKCDKPQSHDYCFNCGRSGVRVTTCPRCRHAYPSYLEKRKKAGFGRDAVKASENTACQANEIQSQHVVQPVSMEDLSEPASEDISSDPVPSGIKESGLWSTAVKSSLKSPVFEEMKISTKIRDIQSTDNSFWQNDNDISIRKIFEITDDYLQDLTNLMDRIKFLSVLDQNSIVLQFISERQKLLDHT